MRVKTKTGQYFDIDIPAMSKGQIKMICPACVHTHSSSNQKNKDLSWNVTDSIGNCKRCGEVFYRPVIREVVKTYSRPEWKNTTDLDEKVVKYFEKRKISQFVLRNNNLVSSGLEFMGRPDVMTIQFNYWRKGELINIKYRTADKKFKMCKDAELIFYNIDSLAGSNDAIITEGEVDCLSLLEAGYKAVVSVPNGAGASMEFIDNCIEDFIGIEKIILCTDQDEPGLKLRDELARRLGVERCYKIDLQDCKDANEYHCRYGIERLREVISRPEPFPVNGVFSTIDIRPEMESIYFNGLPAGVKINHKEHDELITWQTGRVYTVTGIPSHGKSEYVDFINVRLNIIHGWKTAYFSPENHPIELHASKILEKITGKSCRPDKLAKKEFDECMEYMDNNFYFIMPEDDFTVDSILSKAGTLVARKGIKILVIDPYNKLDHSIVAGTSETTYISQFYDKISNFAVKKDVMVVLVAHPKKMNKKSDGNYEIPNLYDISGSANFYNKTDFGITVYRDFTEDSVTAYIQKVKFKHMGQTGQVKFKYNKDNGRFDFNNGYDVIPDIRSYFKTDPVEKIEPINANIIFDDAEPPY